MEPLTNRCYAPEPDEVLPFPRPSNSDILLRLKCQARTVPAGQIKCLACTYNKGKQCTV